MEDSRSVSDACRSGSPNPIGRLSVVGLGRDLSLFDSAPRPRPSHEPPPPKPIIPHFRPFELRGPDSNRLYVFPLLSVYYGPEAVGVQRAVLPKRAFPINAAAQTQTLARSSVFVTLPQRRNYFSCSALWW